MKSLSFALMASLLACVSVPAVAASGFSMKRATRRTGDPGAGTSSSPISM